MLVVVALACGDDGGNGNVSLDCNDIPEHPECVLIPIDAGQAPAQR